VVYFYDEGLARFATVVNVITKEPYDTNSLGNIFSHLTNTSINKLSPSLESEKEDVGAGCKWTLKKLKSYFQSRGVSFEALLQNIKTQIMLTLIPAVHEIPLHPSGAFELYGFGFIYTNKDFLIDDQLKTWILGKSFID
jgi:tubulin polyglutamylase TTLL2